MLNSPLLVSDNFLNEAHYVLIDFSYSLSTVNTPEVLIVDFAPHPSLPLPSSTCVCLSMAPPGSYQSIPEQQHTAEHLREQNGFQLAKQIPRLTLTPVTSCLREPGQPLQTIRI